MTKKKNPKLAKIKQNKGEKYRKIKKKNMQTHRYKTYVRISQNNLFITNPKPCMTTSFDPLGV